jgi:hypothetical protein|tara:strand:+ start:73 stop:1725 length:1653 start_codon:yes stop_codon:yes gene_type:complete
MKKEEKNLNIDNFIEGFFINSFLDGRTRDLLNDSMNCHDSFLKDSIKIIYNKNKEEIDKGFSFILKNIEKHGMSYPFFKATEKLKSKKSKPPLSIEVYKEEFTLDLHISKDDSNRSAEIHTVYICSPITELTENITNNSISYNLIISDVTFITKCFFQSFWFRSFTKYAKISQLQYKQIKKEKAKLSKEVKTLENEAKNIAKQINTLEKENKSLKESSYPVTIKTPINTFNVMLTDSNKTLSKINKAIKKLENYKETVKDPKEKKIIQTQIEKGNEMFVKAEQNFPENFEFTVYEQYAIYGAFKLLTNNGYSPVQMYFADILKALGFVKEDGKSVNKSEITKIKEAFKKLTEQKFPCYIAKETAPNKFTFYDNDEPLFKLKEVNTLDLNIQLSDKEITKKSLILSLENMQLIQDLQQFHTFINSNILRNLRLYKNQVQEKDLYFLAYLIKEHFCKQKDSNPNSTISLIKLAKILRLPDSNFIGENTWKDRKNRRRFIKNIETLSAFMIKENILKCDPEFSKDFETVVFYYDQYKEKKGNSQKYLKANLVT